jgi:GYF domain 2
MGIKFHCPQGHKLNVKAFLAGKKGVCPKCGTKVRIPLTSEAALADSEVEETDASESPVKSNGSGKVPAPAVAVVPATSARDGDHDPISEAPTAIWYVRPPTGGQYGPARGDVMRKWLSEGRVSSDSLVWREGWTDWQNAGKLFPALQGAGAAVPQSAMPAVSTTVPISPRATLRAATKYETKKRDSNALAIAMLVGLGLVCLVLMAVLALVWFNLR